MVQITGIRQGTEPSISEFAYRVGSIRSLCRIWLAPAARGFH